MPAHPLVSAVTLVALVTAPLRPGDAHTVAGAQPATSTAQPATSVRGTRAAVTHRNGRLRLQKRGGDLSHLASVCREFNERFSATWPASQRHKLVPLEVRFDPRRPHRLILMVDPLLLAGVDRADLLALQEQLGLDLLHPTGRAGPLAAAGRDELRRPAPTGETPLHRLTRRQLRHRLEQQVAAYLPPDRAQLAMLAVDVLIDGPTYMDDGGAIAVAAHVLERAMGQHTGHPLILAVPRSLAHLVTHAPTDGLEPALEQLVQQELTRGLRAAADLMFTPAGATLLETLVDSLYEQRLRKASQPYRLRLDRRVLDLHVRHGVYNQHVLDNAAQVVRAVARDIAGIEFDEAIGRLRVRFFAPQGDEQLSTILAPLRQIGYLRPGETSAPCPPPGFRRAGRCRCRWRSARSGRALLQRSRSGAGHRARAQRRGRRRLPPSLLPSPPPKAPSTSSATRAISSPLAPFSPARRIASRARVPASAPPPTRASASA
jgi:hypothetical protein